MEIFISYAEEDREASLELERRLRESGFIVHLDKLTVRVGEGWREILFSKIRSCRSFILLWSDRASRSPHVFEETLEAYKYKKPILPCVLDDSPVLSLIQDIQPLALKDISAQYPDLLSRLGFEPGNLPESAHQDFQSALSSYRALVTRKFGDLQVLFRGRKKDIDSAYVELALTPGFETGRTKGELSARQVFDLAQETGAKYIIAGHPGTGKTSTLHYLMHRWGAGDAKILPIYARLKEFEPRLHRNFEEFVLEQFYAIQTPPTRRIFQEASVFENYRCLLLLDGLDEVPAGSYQHLAKGVLDFSERNRLASFIITTRIDGFRDKREEDFLGWDIFSIARLGSEKIREFVELWFENEEKRENLLTKIQSPRLNELAGRAFLLALICLVFEEEGDLGENRSALYEQATLYLEKSRSGRSVTKVQEFRRRILKDIALLYLQLSGRELDERLLAALVVNSIGEQIAESPKDFLDSLVSDTGLLQNHAGTYLFTHKSFQEYYASLALCALENGQELMLDYCQVSHWEEPIRLYAGSITKRGEQEDFIRDLWLRNPALALRTATECHQLAPAFLGSLIVDSSPENRVRMIGEVQSSLRAIDPETARTLAIETLAPLFSCERDSAVLYFGIQLLQEFDPEDSGGVLYRTFRRYSEDLFAKLVSDEKYKFAFVSISAGIFMMGDDDSQDKIERPTHRVSVDAFEIGRFQLTNLAWEAIMGVEHSRREDGISEADDQPVINVNWYDAYICGLRVGCRLPTEAEWEYAARAGSSSQWCFGDEKELLTQYANFEESGRKATWPVGTGLPNAWGLHDVHGNVWEWCQDWLGPYSEGFQANPRGPRLGAARVRRGGGHAYHARGCRSAFRWGNDPAYRFKDIGVRLAR